MDLNDKGNSCIIYILIIRNFVPAIELQKMNKRNLLFYMIIFVGIKVSAQERIFKTDKSAFAQIDFSAVGTPMLNEFFLGYSMDIKFSPKDKFFTGISYTKSGKIVDNDFGLGINSPVINYYDVSWVNQYRIVQNKHLRMNLSLNNGVAFIRLGNDEIREIVHDPFYGTASMPKKIVLDTYYLVEPGVDFQVPIKGHENYVKLYLTGKLKYRCLIGHGTLGDNHNLNNIYTSLGVSYMIYHP